MIQPYKNRYKSWRYLQPIQRSALPDAALPVEELAEIYSTPTPNAMMKTEKIVLIECSSFLFYNNQGLIFIPETQIWILLKYDSLKFLK